MIDYLVGERDIREEKSPRFCVLTLGIFVVVKIIFNYLLIFILNNAILYSGFR
ncbi:hypothetical protein SELR_12800 [Selenomonas ruminantium subsp. lactilytica TAM6421]|uniref:Uncharacterized protein n=1 Tax=Selenomonas ruminantium subsp. lactilytica (strain NBRC 103574 / TAM6421) TaxID=927704 RepID=I0GQF1_SELRL|nr:hypothetical protein SELR_12800 [Selenomonas ruminantium subsp. lactilytica TAM6421]